MRRILVSFAARIFLLAVLLFDGCDMHLDKQKALETKCRTEIGELLVSIENYKNQHGALPPNLDELRKTDTTIQNILTSNYTYDAKGIVIKDGSSWLITIADPRRTNELMVGRLPIEVAVKEPRIK